MASLAPEGLCAAWGGQCFAESWFQCSGLLSVLALWWFSVLLCVGIFPPPLKKIIIKIKKIKSLFNK